MRDFDLITFDCYGTLIDWESGMRKALEALGRELRRELPADELVPRYIQLELDLERKRYRLYKEILAIGLTALLKEQGIDLDSRRAGVFSRSLSRWEPFPEAREVLERLRRRGYRTAVLSNIDDSLLRLSLRRLGVEFDYMVTAERVRSYKPGLEHWRRALALSKTPKSRVLHVAASFVHDIIPARKLGLQCAWINRHRLPAPSGTRPNHVFHDLRPLTRLLGPDRR